MPPLDRARNGLESQTNRPVESEPHLARRSVAQGPARRHSGRRGHHVRSPCLCHGPCPAWSHRRCAAGKLADVHLTCIKTHTQLQGAASRNIVKPRAQVMCIGELEQLRNRHVRDVRRERDENTAAAHHEEAERCGFGGRGELAQLGDERLVGGHEDGDERDPGEARRAELVVEEDEGEGENQPEP